MELGLLIGLLALIYSVWATIQINNYQLKINKLEVENIELKNHMLEKENEKLKQHLK